MSDPTQRMDAHEERVEGFSVVPLVPPGDAKRGPRVAIGSHASNDLVIEEPRVSRFHCEIATDPRGVRIRDVGSSNGTLVDGVRVSEAWLRSGSVVTVGGATIRVVLDEPSASVVTSTATSFGALVGTSFAMRCVFGVLERVASTEATVLVEGETGTGKELVAESLHAASPRARGPLVIVDCGSLPANLVESELFGHERGAFTGAVESREGAFEAADGGTLVLDEIGELPLEAQPRLLRALETRTVRRVGASKYRSVDVRVVACTNRDLRREVNERRFRSDLYYRLAVVRVTLPPLRERPDDVEPLTREILGRARVDEATRLALTSPEHLGRLRRRAWPGNVRELRNELDRIVALRLVPDAATSEDPASPDPGPPAMIVDPRVPYAEARRSTLARFERAYFEALLDDCSGDVQEAAKIAGVDRSYVYRILRRRSGACG